jgi:hypothetical protein
MKSRTLCVLTLLLLAAAAPAQEIRTDADMERYIGDLLASVVDGAYQRAFDVIRTHDTTIPDTEIDALQTSTRQQIESAEDRYGRSINYQFYDRQEVDDLMVQYTYLVVMERHLLRWRFVFFDKGGSWLLSHVEWDDRVHRVFNW